MFRSPLLADCLAIAIGGAIGALLRHWITRLAIYLPGGSGPLGTLAANLIGCLAIGLLVGYVVSEGSVGDRHQLAIRTGLLGSLTTFSTFALETVRFGSEQRWLAAIAYAGLNIGLGLVAVLVGIGLGKTLATK